MILPTLIQGQHKSSPSRYQYIKQADGSYKRVKLNVSSFSSGSSLDFVISSSFKVSGVKYGEWTTESSGKKIFSKFTSNNIFTTKQTIGTSKEQLQLQQEYLPDPQQEQDPQSKQQF